MLGVLWLYDVNAKFRENLSSGPDLKQDVATQPNSMAM
jgi:hypothetical protein